MGPGDLSRALAALPVRSDPRLLVGRETFDDAGVFRISDDLALVQTVDFFAPIVDDPFDFGQIAAANALSDVYAMGGQPLTALNIVAFPTSELPLEVLSAILFGGQEPVHEAGALVVGGHTVIAGDRKSGLAVPGRGKLCALASPRMEPSETPSICGISSAGPQARMKIERFCSIRRRLADWRYASVETRSPTIFHVCRDRRLSARSSTGEKLRSKFSEKCGGGWGLVASVIFKITVTLRSRVGWVRFPHSPAISLLLGMFLAQPALVAAQQRDSARAGITAAAGQRPPGTQPDTTHTPPMSPRREFRTSLVLPAS